ncbi:MAG: hypothetical protein Q4G70_09830 [Pseudomonadota bacterium]|nr:hypothetical protein [Pseudomonadota bacterium]
MLMRDDAMTAARAFDDGAARHDCGPIISSSTPRSGEVIERSEVMR